LAEVIDAPNFGAKAEQNELSDYNLVVCRQSTQVSVTQIVTQGRVREQKIAPKSLK
jgi:hypothetical protein